METIKELDDISQKIITLKNNIEKEINEINKLYDKTINDFTKSFQERHEQLLKQENDLKEKLQTETTKIKEKLENYLSESNNIIKINEKISKGIKKFENEEKNIIQNLNYVSKINKNKKDMKQLFQKLMKNLKFSFDNEKNTIQYNEYYFNGIPEPKNINFKDISSNSVNIEWKIDDINLINIDKNKIKYKVELRKKNKKFIQVYEGNNSNCLIDNLSEEKKYEIKICSFYHDLIESWSPINNFITPINIGFKSNIIKDEINFVFRYIKKYFSISKKIKTELIYRASSDGPYPKI